MAIDKKLETAVIKIVRDAANPLKPLEVEKKVASRVKAKRDIVHETIVSLLDRGRLKVTLDLRLRAGD